MTFTNRLRDINPSHNVHFDDKVVNFRESGKFLGAIINQLMSDSEDVKNIVPGYQKLLIFFISLNSVFPNMY